MGFQTSVDIYRGSGQVGHPANSGHMIESFSGGPGSFRADEDGVTIGSFVFQSATENLVTNVAVNATDKPLGFVQNLAQGRIDYGESYSMLIPGGREISPKVRGTFWALSSTVATVGQKVFASIKDGSIATGAAGATVADHVETNYYVTHGAAVGDLIIISTWSNQ